jgi:tyrosyl-DNA phosphodiesterase 2
MLTICTFNVWFDRLASAARQKALFELLTALAPSVVCLQEVTPTFNARLSHPDFFLRYTRSDTEGCDRFGYGTVMYVRNELRPVFSRSPFDSRMGRDLLIAEITLPGGGVAAVATVHLESLDNARLRQVQLQKCSERLSAYPMAILCGDFNFDSYVNFSELPREERFGSSKHQAPHPPPLPLVRPPHLKPLENSCLARELPGWIDAWAELHPDEHGFTFDTKVRIHSCRHVDEAKEAHLISRFIFRRPTPCSLDIITSVCAMIA